MAYAKLETTLRTNDKKFNSLIRNVATSDRPYSDGCQQKYLAASVSFPVDILHSLLWWITLRHDRHCTNRELINTRRRGSYIQQKSSIFYRSQLEVIC